MEKTGKFIVFEGIDGCGKSTHAKLLAEWLTEQGTEVLHTKEPSRGPIGLLLRDYLQSNGNGLVDALLFTADRAEHVEKEINPALAEGKIVLCERYFYSTMAYQTAQGLDINWLRKLNEFAPTPDLILFLDLRPDIAVQRAASGEKFETLEFLTKVRENYLTFSEKDEFYPIETKQGKNIVQDAIRERVQKLI